MCPLVTFQVFITRESLVTVGTVESCIYCMWYLVCLQVTITGESPITVRAYKGLLPSMDPLVCLQVTRREESFVTVRTGQRLISCMIPLMGQDFSSVIPLVFITALRLGESLFTVGT